MRLSTLTCLLSAAVLGVSACGTMPVPAGYSAAFTCQRELGAFGTYRVPTGVDVPVVEPIQDGTQRGADAINACIRAKAQQGDAGVYSLPDVAGVPQSMSTTQVSDTRTTSTYTYGTPPATAQAGTSVSRPRTCVLTMTGGTGYSCARR